MPVSQEIRSGPIPIRRNESYGGPGGHSAAVAEAPPDYGSRVRHSAVIPQSLRSTSAVLPH